MMKLCLNFTVINDWAFQNVKIKVFSYEYILLSKILSMNFLVFEKPQFKTSIAVFRQV